MNFKGIYISINKIDLPDNIVEAKGAFANENADFLF